ncbi:MAG: hypothetical protein CMG59_01680, partial [Candidatus Marinimicrobia bacterium]|nr:hypothetical protein [Candidatus Neomarinimicrobiota bacterium]
MKFFTKILIGLNLIGAFLFPGIENTETGWAYSQSTFQAFYMLESTQIDGIEIDASDVIGAFKDGECLGWVYGDSDGYTTIPVMGNDGSSYTSNYLNSNDIPDLLIYDSTQGSILNIIPGSILPGWSNNEIFIIDGVSSASNTFGCKDETACNYDSDATADDGSCWSANEGCTCDDAQGSEADCLGECNGTAVVDDCNVCDGGNADKDCAGDCFGDALEDGCGVCDSDSSNDNDTCTGCTDACADNYDQGNLFDDGSCAYTIPGIQNLTASSGPARVILSWDAPVLSDDCQANLSYEVYDTGLSLVKETANTTTQILGLEPGIEYCYQVLATNDNGDSSLSSEVCATPEIAGGISWGLQLTAGISGWGMFDEVDSYNYLGVAPNGTNDYDNGLDIPEPPMNSATNFISLHFTHEEWGNVFGNYFTQDVRLEDDEYFSENLVVWEADVISNMSGDAYILIEHYNTPLSVPMYGEFDGEFFAIEDGSMIEFFLQEAIPQRLTIYIGNIVPEAPGSLSATGGDRSISLDWDDDAGLYPATSYNVYRDGALIANVTDSNYFDDEDMEGHQGQGLLYESSYDYTVTGVNDAGESTKGHELSNHDGTTTVVDGRQSDDSATTDDNLDPISVVSNLESQDGTNIGEGIYEIPHNFDIDANRITISIDGSSSSDSDEFDEISSYSWSQVSGPDTLVLTGSDSDTVSFEVSNANGNSDKVYTLNLNVTADYPIKGGFASRQSDAEISVTIQDEPNEAPNAPSPVDIIVGGDNLASYTMDDWIDDDGNDYDSSKSLWVVPHDGDPDSSEASLHFTASASSDPDDTDSESDELSYRWETGLDNEPFVDLNGDGTWSANEPYTDIDEDGEWDDGDVFYNGINLNVLRLAGEYTFTLIVSDEYGASSSSEIVIGVEAEHNESPSSIAGDDQEWFMPNDLDEFEITIDDNSGSDNDNDSLSFGWSLDGYDSDGNSNGGWLDLVESLPVGDHIFT